METVAKRDYEFVEDLAADKDGGHMERGIEERQSQAVPVLEFVHRVEEQAVLPEGLERRFVNNQ